MTNSTESSTSATTSTPENEEAVNNEEVISAQPEPEEQRLNKWDWSRYTKEQREERRQKVWHMKVVERMTNTSIAKSLGISRDIVAMDLKEVSKHKVKTLSEQDRQFIVEQDEIYQALLTKWLPIAIRPDGPDTDPEIGLRATDKITNALASQAKLHGFGAAGKVSPKEAGKEIGEAVLKAMRELAHGGKIIDAEVVQPKLEDQKYG